MPVRTTRIDVSALARSAPASAPRGRTGGGGGSFGLGLAPPPPHFTNFEVELNTVDELMADEAEVGRFRVQPSTATFSLVNDAGERFAIAQDNGADVVDEDGWRTLITYGDLAAVDAPYAIMLRATDGAQTHDYPIDIPVQVVPLEYSIQMTATSFNHTNMVPGQGVADFQSLDPRVSIDSVVLTDDAGGVFTVVNRANLVLTEEPVADGEYALVATITFMDGHVEYDYAFTLEAHSVG